MLEKVSRKMLAEELEGMFRVPKHCNIVKQTWCVNTFAGVVLQTKAFLTRAFVTAKAVGAFEVKSTNILPFGAFIDFYTYGKRKEVKLRRKKKKKKKKIQYTKTSFDKPSHFPSFKRKPLPLQIHLWLPTVLMHWKLFLQVCFPAHSLISKYNDQNVL